MTHSDKDRFTHFSGHGAAKMVTAFVTSSHAAARILSGFVNSRKASLSKIAFGFRAFVVNLLQPLRAFDPPSLRQGEELISAERKSSPPLQKEGACVAGGWFKL